MATDVPIAAALSLEGLGTDARDGLDVASSAGYRGVAFATNHPELKPADLSQSGRRQLRHILASKHLRGESIRVAAPRGGLSDPATIDRTVENTRAAIRLAQDLGIATLSLDAGPLAHPLLSAGTVQDAARLLSEEAEHAGLRLALSSESPEKLAELMGALGASPVRANFETLRLIAAGQDVVAAIGELAGKGGERIGQVTLADAIRAGRQVRATELGAGQVPLAEILAQLEAHHFTGPLVVDVRDLANGREGAENAARLLRKILNSEI